MKRRPRNRKGLDGGERGREGGGDQDAGAGVGDVLAAAECAVGEALDADSEEQRFGQPDPPRGRGRARLV